MTPNDPLKLPKLPPLRESAEQVLPPAPEEPRVERVTEDVVPTAPEPVVEQPPPRARRRDGRRPRTEDGRRFSTAGHALVVAVLALLFGALLLAPGMHKAAYNGQPGTKRDVALALTSGLTHVSHALFLDRPRKLVQDAMGRGHADEINVAIVAPPPTTEPTTTTPVTKPTTNPAQKPAAKPKPPAKIAFSPKKKMRIWVGGDSLVITPGYAIVRAAGASPAIASVGGVDGHVATGLTRPDVFNWFQEIATKVKELKPNVVVLNFGANDNHNYMTGLPEGTSIGEFAGPSWSKEYLRRVRIVMDTINRVGATVVWIGLPIVSSPTVTEGFDKINAIVVKEAKRRGPQKAIYIDTYTMFAGDNGGFTEYLENAKGDPVKVRAGDGVHFDTAGGDMIAREVLRQLNKVYDLTSWRHKQQKGA
jgi:hypothetical protein